MAFFQKLLWKLVTAIGTRRLSSMVRLASRAYESTIFCVPDRDGVVALTIDDGLCRSGPENHLVHEVRALLASHSARATFFL